MIIVIDATSSTVRMNDCTLNEAPYFEMTIDNNLTPKLNYVRDTSFQTILFEYTGR